MRIVSIASPATPPTCRQPPLPLAPRRYVSEDSLSFVYTCRTCCFTIVHPSTFKVDDEDIDSSPWLSSFKEEDGEVDDVLDIDLSIRSNWSNFPCFFLYELASLVLVLLKNQPPTQLQHHQMILLLALHLAKLQDLRLDQLLGSYLDQTQPQLMILFLALLLARTLGPTPGLTPEPSLRSIPGSALCWGGNRKQIISWQHEGMLSWIHSPGRSRRMETSRNKES